MIIAFQIKANEIDPEFTLKYFRDLLLAQHNAEMVAYAYKHGDNMTSQNGTLTVAELEWNKS